MEGPGGASWGKIIKGAAIATAAVAAIVVAGAAFTPAGLSSGIGQVTSMIGTVATTVGGLIKDAAIGATKLALGPAMDGTAGIAGFIQKGVTSIAEFAAKGPVLKHTGGLLTKNAALALGGAGLTGAAIAGTASIAGNQIDKYQEQSGFTR